MPSYRLMILTPEGAAYEGNVESLIAPGLEGFFGVLANHAPMIASVRLGVLTITAGGQDSHFVLPLSIDLDLNL